MASQAQPTPTNPTTPQQAPQSNDGLSAAFDKVAPTAPTTGDNSGLNAAFDKAAGNVGGAGGSWTPAPPQGILENVLSGAAEIPGGIMKGASESVVGLANLTARAIEKMRGLPEGSLQSKAIPVTPPSTGQKVGEAAETVGEFIAGDEAVDGVLKMTQLPEKALALADKYPTVFKAIVESEKAKAAAKIIGGAAKGATIGGAQGAAKGASQGAEKAPEAAKAGAEGGAVGGAVAEIPGIAAKALEESKFGRAAVNRSMDVDIKNVRFGNPARAIDREGIWSVKSGDWQAYRDAIRAGQSPEQAAQAAGGRFAAIYGKINNLEPQLNQMLEKSPATISVQDSILDPLNREAEHITEHFGLTDAEKEKFLGKIDEIKSDWGKRLADRGDISPLEANQMKQDIGEAVDNWSKNINDMPPENVQRAYVAVYESLKNAVNKAVPEAADLNNRLSDLYSARNAISHLAQEQEIGRGTGMMGGTLGAGTWFGRLESEVGRFLPGATQGLQAATPAFRATLPPLAAGYSRVMLSNGAIATIPTENVERLQTRDPGAQVLESQQTQNP